MLNISENVTGKYSVNGRGGGGNSTKFESHSTKSNSLTTGISPANNNNNEKSLL